MVNSPIYEETDPIEDWFEYRQDVRLFSGPGLDKAEVVLNGEWYYLTFHAVQRFIERIDDEMRNIFPHLDLSIPTHALCAMITVLKEAVPGTFDNKKSGGDGFYGSGWVFVVMSEGPKKKVVTCYPKNAITRFYATSSQTG